MDGANTQRKSFICGANEQGQRLDAALSALFPGLGLRARRRLWEWNRVLVDGAERKPGFILRAGQVVELEPQAPHPDEGAAAQAPAQTSTLKNKAALPGPGLRILKASGLYLALAKAPGLASAAIAGSPRPSAEALLTEFWPDLWSEYQNLLPGQAAPAPCPAKPPLLCNRLDTGTSGILLAAFSSEALQSFRQMEAEGKAEKFYLALVRGKAGRLCLLNQALRTDKRQKTLVLDQLEEDQTRHSAVTPLAEYAGLSLPALPLGAARLETPGPLSLVGVTIKRGARHQIRAHLAAAGLPILGDPLYGAEAAEKPRTRLYLHHLGLRLPGFSALCPANWDFIPPGLAWPGF